jgi:hypothetical protein
LFENDFEISSRVGRRIYKLGLLPGLILAAPLLVGTLWFAWSAWASVDRYRRAMGEKGGVDLSLYQIALYDELHRDLKWLTLPARPDHGGLPTIALSLSRDNLDRLDQQLAQDGESNEYVKGLLEKDGRVHEVNVRYRGEQAWQTLGAQKSLKIQLKRGDLLDGIRTFNLLNDPTPFGLEDQLILDLAREQGLLAPELQPVWVRLNNHDLGVFRFVPQPDETLIRRGQRIPGNMYSGDTEETDPATKVGALFQSDRGWQKVADKDQEHPEDRRELLRFLAAINGASHLEFARYAETELDLPRWALFDALDVIFAGSEHDYYSNQKIYADPYRGKLEPVAFSFRGFQHEAGFNLVDHPLLLRLKMTPDYLARRDRAIYQLLTQGASVPAIRARAVAAMEAMADELAADPYWDAYKLLPRATKGHRFFLRPMTMDRWRLAAEAELEGLASRSRFLLDTLEDPGLSLGRGAFLPDAQGHLGRYELEIRGHAAYQIERWQVSGPCAGNYSVHPDLDQDGILDPTEVAVAHGSFGESDRPTGRRTLTARARLLPHPDPSPKRGRTLAEPVPTRYTFFIKAQGCAPTGGNLVLSSLITSASVRLELGGPARPLSPIATATAGPQAVPRLRLGEEAPHPWSYPEPPPPRAITLGPGPVELPEGREFLASESVQIKAGTELRLGPGASLIFHGPVEAIGTSVAPIRVVRRVAETPFGGLALQGPNTAGSRLVAWVVEGGSRAQAAAVDYTGVVNLHDSADLLLEDWVIRNTSSAEDVLHANGVRGLELHELRIEGAPTDGIDLEFVQGNLRGLWVHAAGDDCLDLMGAELRLQDSLLTGCTSNGISAGEETRLTAHGLLVADAKAGVLAKNASEVTVLRSLIFRVEQGLRARRKAIRYGGRSRIGGSEVFIAEAKLALDSDKGSQISVDRVQTERPVDGDLPHLLEQVLRRGSWTELDAALAEGGPR